MITTAINHIQGMAVYGDYTIITVNGHGQAAKLFIYDKAGLIQTLTLPDDVDEHSSGMQVCGNLLAILARGTILFVDLRPLNEGGEAAFLPVDRLPSGGGMAVGITNYTDRNGVEKLLIVNTNGTMLESPIPEDGTSFQWTRRGQYSGPKAETQNIALVTDTENNVYLFAFASEDSQEGSITDLIDREEVGGMNFDDSIRLYALDVHSS